MAAAGHLTVAAILVAAGSGLRLGAAQPKAFCSVGGRTLLEHAVDAFAGHPLVRDVVVVAPPDAVEHAARLAAHATVVAGGPTRQASVSCGLTSLSPDVDAVLVHDVARPFTPSAVIDRVIGALAAGADAVIPTRPIIDTVKRVDASGAVVETIDRTALRAVQTPQGFRRAVLVAAHEFGSGTAATDDAALVEARGGRVVAVDGADESFKITRPWDLILAEALAAR